MANVLMSSEIKARGTDDLPRVVDWLMDNITAAGASVVALYGEMGTGKTTLVSALAQSMDVLQTPSSPTFALINDYTTEGGETIHHFDFYRIKSVAEAYDFGYQEYFFSGELCLIEWPELVEELLPEGCLRVRITAPTEDERVYQIV